MTNRMKCHPGIYTTYKFFRDITAQLTRIPAASTGDNKAETSSRTNIASGTGIGGQGRQAQDVEVVGDLPPIPVPLAMLVRRPVSA